MATIGYYWDWELYDSLNSVVEKVRLFTFLAFEERNQTLFIIVYLTLEKMHVPYELKSQEVWEQINALFFCKERQDNQ
jgi:hypothetical protein